MRRIAVITGSRADRSPLKNVIRLLGESCIYIQTTGLYGHEAFIKETLEREKPDFVVILGDRYETLVAAGVAALLTIPIVHLHGGEITEGAVDDAFRHAISKLAYYHFVSHAKYKRRLERMGESPDRIFVLGAPGVDALAESHMALEEMEKDLGVAIKHPFALVCYHPATLGSDEFDTVLSKLDSYETVIVSGSNADAGGNEINQKWAAWHKETGKGIFRLTFSSLFWRSLMWQADALIGNSSGFVIEGYTLQQMRGGKPEIIIIGDRQAGRYEDMVEFCSKEQYPLGTPGEVSRNIANTIMHLPIPSKPRKEFYE